MKKNSKKQIITTVIVIAVFFLLAALVAKPLVTTVSDPEAFRDWVTGKGALGYVVFALLNIAQVIFAVIPAGPFEIASGYAFGIWQGILICDVACAIGSSLVFWTVRKCGTKFTDYLISFDKLENAKFMKNESRLFRLLLLIFLIPGSPKDVLTYAVGLTNLSYKKWLVINLIGRLPAIVLSVISGSALGTKQYHIAIILWGVILVLYIAGLLIYRKMNHEKATED